MSFNNGEMVGNYRILEQLGQGGMATVFKAYHAALDRYVALKVLHPALLEDKNFLARFQREARLVAKLEHPNIVPVFDYSEHEDRPYLVMKFVEGQTLKARLQQVPLTLDEIPRVVETVGLALAYAHKEGILHRDIKPSNVMLANDGHVYLADFGLARIVQAGESTLTSDMIVGTPQYISPEQAVGKKDLDEGTDIYSFGVMLYEMLVGRVPFSADTPYAVIHDHIYSPLPLPSVVNPSVVPEMERMLLKALAKERHDRFKDVPEMVRAFKEAWDVQVASLLAAKQQVSTPDAETIPPAGMEPPTPSPVVVEPEPEPAPEITPAPVPVLEPIAPAAVAVGPEPESPLEPVSKPPAKEAKEAKTRPRLSCTLFAVGLLLFASVALFIFIRRAREVVVIPATRTAIASTQTPFYTAVKVPPSPAPAYPPGVLFQANFGDGKIPEGWGAEAGWNIQNGTLCSNKHSFTGDTQAYWRDYVASFRVKVDQGTIHLNLRHNDAQETRRYFLSFTPGVGVGLSKQVGEIFTENLAGLDYPIEPGKWFDVQMVAQGDRILMLVDGIIVVDYVDPQPLQSGGISFETLEDSSACVDDIQVSDLIGKAKFDIWNEQHFDDQTSLQGWHLMDGAGNPNNTWSVQTGALCSSGHNWAIFRDLNLTDFNASFRLSMRVGSLHMNFRLHDQPPWRYRIWVGTGGNNVGLTRDYTGKEKLLVTGRASILPSKWYGVRVSLIDGRLQMWINDKRIFDVTDKDPLSGGFIGFESLDDGRNVCIDDLVITKPSLAKIP